jgi:phosphoenolpyruvate synthase/pyruvate phosphate dikinase
MVISVPHGMHEVDVLRFLRNETSLNDEQIGETANLALTLEATTEHSIDVEYAYASGELYLLQCRPSITQSKTA